MKTLILKHSLYTLIALSPLTYLAIMWRTVPEIVPTHFGINGPDAYGHKSMLITFTCMLALISIGCYFLLQYIDLVDPKRAGKPIPPAFNKIAIGLVFFCMATNLIVLLKIVKNIDLHIAILPMIGLFFAFLGNMMHNLKPNYFVGIKIAWTLSSDYNWRKTHQLAGKIWFVGGLCFTIVGIALPQYITSTIIRIFVGIMIVVPITYSFILYKKEQANPDITNTNN